MAFSIQYKPLFNVNIFHNYFLDKGTETFAAMNDVEKSKRLGAFNADRFMNIVPTSETMQKLRGHNLVFKKTNTGFSVWSKVSESDEKKPFIALADDEGFTFLLKPNDPRFFNYTVLEAASFGKLFYFSNQRLPDEPGTFPLIGKTGDDLLVDDGFVLSPDSEEAERKKLENNLSNGVFGVLRIFMKGDESALNVTDAQNEIQTPAPTFEIIFNNRKTFWRYIFNVDQSPVGGDDLKIENGDPKILVTKNVLPLTKDGFVSIELGGVELPNANARNLQPDPANNKYYSELYIHL